MRRAEVDLRAKVLADPWYRRCWPDLRSFMSRSRSLRKEPDALLELQSDMASALATAQESKRRLESDLGQCTGGDSSSLDRPEVAIAVAKRLLHVIKQIGDGIAWRALNYDRPVIRQLAAKPQTGYMELESAVQEFASASRHVEQTGEMVVMNDLTNFLRYGDYTCVGPGRVTIAEYKGGEAAQRSSRAGRQRRRLEEVLGFVNTGVRDTDHGRDILLRQKVKARTHLSTIAKLIREARQKGASYARLSRSLAVDILYFELLAEISHPKRMASFFHDPFHQTREKVTYHSLSPSLFQQFSPNVAPYSIYPFNDEDCSDIMLGTVWLLCYFNYRNLARCLMRRGLTAQLPTGAQQRAYSSLSIAERRRTQDQVAMRVWLPQGTRGVMLNMETTARMFAEFLDEESFADGVEEVLSRDDLFSGHDASVRFRPGFANEAELWD